MNADAVLARTSYTQTSPLVFSCVWTNATLSSRDHELGDCTPRAAASIGWPVPVPSVALNAISDRPASRDWYATRVPSGEKTPQLARSCCGVTGVNVPRTRSYTQTRDSFVNATIL